MPGLGFRPQPRTSSTTPVDLNQLLIQNAPVTFLYRAEGWSMLMAGICDGDILVVDRSVPTQDAMDLAYLTGQRPADTLGFGIRDVRDGYLHVSQAKTGEGLRIAVEGDIWRYCLGASPCASLDTSCITPDSSWMRADSRWARTSIVARTRQSACLLRSAAHADPPPRARTTPTATASG